MSIIEEDAVILAAMAVEPQLDWWDAFAKDNYSNEKCLQYFKCSRKTFTFLVKSLKPHIAPKIGALDSESPLYLRKGNYHELNYNHLSICILFYRSICF